jgi:hypothetical protein
MGVREVVLQAVDWIHLAQVHWWWSLMNMMMNLLLPKSWEILLAECTINF